MLARADGTFQIAGQFAVASFDGRAREVLERFDIRTPLTAQGPAAIAGAQGQAIDQLASQIVARLRR